MEEQMVKANAQTLMVYCKGGTKMTYEKPEIRIVDVEEERIFTEMYVSVEVEENEEEGPWNEWF